MNSKTPSQDGVFLCGVTIKKARVLVPGHRESTERVRNERNRIVDIFFGKDQCWREADDVVARGAGDNAELEQSLYRLFRRHFFGIKLDTDEKS